MTKTTEYAAVGDEMLEFADQSFEISPINEDFEEQVQEAQEQLLKLRHQQEQVEKQKDELEELSKQQEQFIRGRAELAERLSRTMATLEREAYEAEKRAEEFLTTKDTYARHLGKIQVLNPEQWPRENLREELARAIGAIQDAELDYKNCMRRVGGYLSVNPDADLDSDASGKASSFGQESQSFGLWFCRGFAFTLPLVLFFALGLAAYLLLFLP